MRSILEAFSPQVLVITTSSLASKLRGSIADLLAKYNDIQETEDGRCREIYIRSDTWEEYTDEDLDLYLDYIMRNSVPTGVSKGRSSKSKRSIEEVGSIAYMRTNLWASTTRFGESPYSLNNHMERLASLGDNLPYPLATCPASHIYRYQDLLLRLRFRNRLPAALILIACEGFESDVLETIRSHLSGYEMTTPKLFISVVVEDDAVDGDEIGVNPNFEVLTSNFPGENCESMNLRFDVGVTMSRDLTRHELEVGEEPSPSTRNLGLGSIKEIRRILYKANYNILESSIHRRIKHLESQVKLQKKGFIRTQVKNYFSWKPDDNFPKQQLADMYRKLGDCYLWINQYDRAVHSYKSAVGEAKESSYCLVAGACASLMMMDNDTMALSNINQAIINSKSVSATASFMNCLLQNCSEYTTIFIRACIALAIKEIKNEFTETTASNSLKYLEWAMAKINIPADECEHLKRAIGHHMSFMILRCIAILLKACSYLNKSNIKNLHHETLKYIQSTFSSDSELCHWEMPSHDQSASYGRCYRQKISALFAAGCSYLASGYPNWAKACLEPICIATLALGVGPGCTGSSFQANDGCWANNRRGYGQWHQQSAIILDTIMTNWNPGLKSLVLGIITQDIHVRIPEEIQNLQFCIPFLVASDWVILKDYRNQCSNKDLFEQQLKLWTGKFTHTRLAISFITESSNYLVIGTKNSDTPLPNIDVLLTKYPNWNFDTKRLEQSRSACRRGSDVLIGFVFFNPFQQLNLQVTNFKLLIGNLVGHQDIVAPVNSCQRFELRGREAIFLKVKIRCPNTDWVFNGVQMDLEDRIHIYHEFVHNPSIEENLLQNWDQSCLLDPAKSKPLVFETTESIIKQFKIYMNGVHTDAIFRYELVHCRISIDFAADENDFSIILSGTDLMVREGYGQPFVSRILLQGKESSVEFQMYTKSIDQVQALRCLVKWKQTALIVVDIFLVVQEAMSIESVQSNTLIFKFRNLLQEQGLRFHYLLNKQKSQSQEVGPVQWYSGWSNPQNELPDPHEYDDVRQIYKCLNIPKDHSPSLEDSIAWIVTTTATKSKLVYIRSLQNSAANYILS